jgi:hypothetical protein
MTTEAMRGGGVAFCTIVEFEWEGPADRAHFEAAVETASRGAVAPEGRLSRIVGVEDTGARVVEVWATPADAQRFAEATAPDLAAVEMPAPTRVETFAVTTYDVA